MKNSRQIEDTMYLRCRTKLDVFLEEQQLKVLRPISTSIPKNELKIEFYVYKIIDSFIKLNIF